MSFYVRTSPEAVPKGPFELSEIVLHIESGWLPLSSEVASPGSPIWLTIVSVPEFAVAFERLRAAGLHVPLGKLVAPTPRPGRGKISCPQCLHGAINTRGCFYVAIGVCLLPFCLIGLVLLLRKPTYLCGNCGFRFKP